MLNVAAVQQQMRELFGTHTRLQDDPAHPFADWWLVAQLLGQMVVQQRRLRAQGAGGIKVLAVNGAQGSGKSSLAAALTTYMCSQGIAADTVSLDDFYLTQQQRQQLAADVHPLLATRGVPGTHDWAWLGQVLQHLQAGTAGSFELPVFDKGLDERVANRTCSADLLIVEGWCLGVTAQPDNALQPPVNALEVEADANAVWRRWVNQQIRLHYEPLWPLVDFWVSLRVPDFAQIFQWRWQQEQQVAPQLRMSEGQLQRFIAHYERLTRWQWRCDPLVPGMVAALDEAHQVVDMKLLTKP